MKNVNLSLHMFAGILVQRGLSVTSLAEFSSWISGLLLNGAFQKQPKHPKHLSLSLSSNWFPNCPQLESATKHLLFYKHSECVSNRFGRFYVAEIISVKCKRFGIQSLDSKRLASSVSAHNRMQWCGVRLKCLTSRKRCATAAELLVSGGCPVGRVPHSLNLGPKRANHLKAFEGIWNHWKASENIRKHLKRSATIWNEFLISWFLIGHASAFLIHPPRLSDMLTSKQAIHLWQDADL